MNKKIHILIASAYLCSNLVPVLSFAETKVDNNITSSIENNDSINDKSTLEEKDTNLELTEDLEKIPSLSVKYQTKDGEDIKKELTLTDVEEEIKANKFLNYTLKPIEKKGYTHYATVINGKEYTHPFKEITLNGNDSVEVVFLYSKDIDNNPSGQESIKSFSKLALESYLNKSKEPLTIFDSSDYGLKLSIPQIDLQRILSTHNFEDEPILNFGINTKLSLSTNESKWLTEEFTENPLLQKLTEGIPAKFTSNSSVDKISGTIYSSGKPNHLKLFKIDFKEKTIKKVSSSAEGTKISDIFNQSILMGIEEEQSKPQNNENNSETPKPPITNDKENTDDTSKKPSSNKPKEKDGTGVFSITKKDFNKYIDGVDKSDFKNKFISINKDKDSNFHLKTSLSNLDKLFKGTKDSAKLEWTLSKAYPEKVSNLFKNKKPLVAMQIESNLDVSKLSNKDLITFNIPNDTKEVFVYAITDSGKTELLESSINKDNTVSVKYKPTSKSFTIAAFKEKLDLKPDGSLPDTSGLSTLSLMGFTSAIGSGIYLVSNKDKKEDE